ncbi:MAG: heat-inducible transcriptional repressor HrcA [Sandaracinaceae bacterium]
MQIPARPRRPPTPPPPVALTGRARAVPDLAYRARKILYALVTEYIATGEPVGSRTLSKRYGLNLSAATIRNELTDLEEVGCVSQPHTSAGRVPTELGFRVFIDGLAQMRDVSERDRSAVLARMRQLRPGVDDVVREAARMLAAMSGAAAVVTRPRADLEPLSQLRFIPLGERRLLVVVVWQSGAVQNRVIEVAQPIEAEELERLHNYLVELNASVGEAPAARSLSELRAALAAAVAKERDAYDGLRRRAKELVDAAAQTPSSDGLVIEGQGALFDRREFEDPEKIRRFLRTFEERERLLELLDRTIAAGGVRVLVGSEAELDAADDVGVISTSYRAHGVPSGSLGVIGPTRLDYAKLMPLVGFTAQVVSDVLDGRSLDDGEDEPGD